jgi:hypothetical protein
MTKQLSAGQQKFNQHLLASHCLEEPAAHNLWNKLAKSHDMGASSFEISMSRSNAQLRSFGLEIVGVSIKKSEEGGFTRYYAMMNQQNDEIAKQAFTSHLTPVDKEYVKDVLEKLCTDGPQTQSALLNLRNTAAMTLTHAEQQLETLVQQKWLTVNEKRVDISPRTYMELGDLLVNHFDLDRESLPQMIYHRE